MQKPELKNYTIYYSYVQYLVQSGRLKSVRATRAAKLHEDNQMRWRKKGGTSADWLRIAGTEAVRC